MSHSIQKVLMVTGSYPPMKCGVGDYTQALVDSLRLKGVDVRVLTTQIPYDDANNQSWIRRTIPKWTWHSYSLFLKEVRDFSPDIVHIQDPTQGYNFATAPVFMIFIARLLRKINIIWTWHEYPHTNIAARYLRNISMAMISKKIIVVRPNYKEHTDRFLSLFLLKKPFIFIPNASVIPKVDMSPDDIKKYRDAICAAHKKIVVYFGFIFEHKGVERLFEILDPKIYHLVLIGDINLQNPYHKKIMELTALPEWKNNATCTGFIPVEEAAKYIKTSDAMLLPYIDGGGGWNTSLHAGIAQGTFVVATSNSEQGYDEKNNVFYTRPDDIPAMRMALTKYAGRKRSFTDENDPWSRIADEHITQYNQLLGTRI